MKKHFLFLSALALFLSSCEVFSPLSEKTGSISIKMPEGSERSEATTDDPVSEITSFTVELYDSERTSGSSPVVQISSVPGESITLESLAPGSYAIFIKAFKPTSKEFAACGEKSGIIVKAGTTTYETIMLRWVITDWETLYAKLNDKSEDVGNIYVSGDFEIASTIRVLGRANIISTGTGVTFSRKEGYASNFFSLYSASLTFKGSESAPIVFDGTSNTQPSNLITNGGTTTFEYCSFKNNSSSNFASVYLMDNYTSSNTTFRFCSFTGNKGPKGGAVYVGETAYNVCFENCRFENNTSSSDGGAVYIAASATGTFSDCTFERNGANSLGKDIYNNGTLNIGGTIGNSAGSIDIYMNNISEYSPVLVPVKGITLANETDTINIKMASCEEGTAVLTKSDSISDEDFANAVKCFTLRNEGFGIADDGKAATTYTVTFNLNYDGNTNTTQSVTSGNAVSEPEVPTRNGYTFAGWYTDTECTVEYNFSGVVTENITLYAKWIEVITDWETLYKKLNDQSGDVGNIYVSGEFDVTSEIIFSGTANIISTSRVTFTRGTDFTDVFFYLNADSLTFSGSESAPIVFDGNNVTARVITNGGTTTFEYCSFVNNSTSTDAPVYFMNNYEFTSTFKFCTFTGNTGYKGGAVYAGTTETVSFENCTFERNTASDCGGAVYIADSATGTFSNCTFKSNTASYYGGAVYIESIGTGSFSDCTFERNSATTSGGAIDSSGTADITNCTFTSNNTKNNTGYGGAINIDSGTMTISSITCSGNSATTGKDIYHSNGTLNIGGTVDGSIDIYMYNNSSSPVLVPVKGITLADETYPINVEMYECSAETTVLTQSAGMTTSDFAAAIKCFTLKNARFVIGSDGKAVSTGI